MAKTSNRHSPKKGRKKTLASKRRSSPRAPPSRQATPSTALDADLAQFRAAYPRTHAMSVKCGKEGGVGRWLKYDQQAAEANDVIRRLGMKELSPSFRSREDSDEEEETGRRWRDQDFAPAGKGWSAWVSYEELARAYQEATSARRSGKGVGAVEVKAVGGPTPVSEGGEIDEPDQVRIAMTWHTTVPGVLTWMREERRRAELDEMEGRDGEDEDEKADAYTAPEAVTLPPRLPKPRQETAWGVIEQYEKFVVVDDIVYSPIRLWGRAPRPKGFNTATLSVRLQHYCGARALGSGDENDSRSLNELKADGKKWAASRAVPGKPGQAKWPELAAELFTSKNN